MTHLPRILAIDDSATNLIALRQILKRVRSELVEARSGSEALQKTLHNQFALVLLDVCMPDMDGYEVAELLRANPAHRATPIIFLTAHYINEQHAFRGYEVGGVDYMCRPINEAMLLAKVKIFLDLYQARAELEQLTHRNEAILRCVGEGIVGLDNEGHIQFTNPAAAQMLGVDETRLIGQSMQRFMLEQRGGRHRVWQNHRIAQALKQQGRSSGDREVFRRLDGSEFPVEFTATPVQSDTALPIQAVMVFQDVTRRREMEHQLVQMASYDALTGFVNRQQFYCNLRDAIARAKRNGSPLVVLFLDIDEFKSVNDSMGHETGDILLAELAERLKHRFREVDKIGRFGGDEFLLYMENVNSSGDLTHVAEELLDLVQQPFAIKEQEIYVTASVGAAVYPEAGEDVSTLIKHADAAMYRAKGLGRNRYFLFTEEVREEASHAVALRAALRRALDLEEFELFFQPRVDLASNKIIGFEALLRWINPQFGAIGPSHFIPVAEENGMIGAIGEWVFRTTCHQVQTWQREGLWTQEMAVSVNLSAWQLGQNGLVVFLDRILVEHGLNPSKFELELTETGLMQHVQAINVLDTLHNRGIGLAIDDFGTGYSSLSYLKRLPISTVKIDRSFVRDVTQDEDDAAIVTAIISMAASLGLHVVAEGVETAAQADFLRRLNCREAQGFHFSVPVPAAQATVLLRANAGLGI